MCILFQLVLLNGMFKRCLTHTLDLKTVTSEKCTPFLVSMNNLFDVAAAEGYRKTSKKIWKVKMKPEDFCFMRTNAKLHLLATVHFLWTRIG